MNYEKVILNGRYLEFFVIILNNSVWFDKENSDEIICLWRNLSINNYKEYIING